MGSASYAAEEDEEDIAEPPSTTFGQLFDDVGAVLGQPSVKSTNQTNESTAPKEPSEIEITDDDSPSSQSQANESINPINNLVNDIGSLLGGGNQNNVPEPEQIDVPSDVTALPEETNKQEDENLWNDFDDNEAVTLNIRYKPVRDRFIKAANAYRYGEAAQILLETGADYNDVAKSDVKLVCETWLHIRHFRKFDICIKAFERRLQKNNSFELVNSDAVGDLVGIRGNREYGEFVLSQWRAIRALEFGDNAKTIMHAKKAVALLQSNKISITTSGAISAIEKIGSIGLNKIIDDTNRPSHSRGLGAEAYGTLAIASNRSGNTRAVINSIVELKRLANQRLGNEYKNRYWLILAYYSSGDFESALYESKLRTKDNIDLLSDVLIGTTLTLTSPVTGDNNYDDYKALGLLEYEYIKASSLYKLNRINEAKNLYDKLLSSPSIDSFGSIYFHLLHDRAKIALLDKDTAKAISLYEKAITVIETQRSTIATESGKLGFAGSKQSIYHDIISLLLEQGRTGHAFEYVERAKARAMVDMLASRQNIRGGNTSIDAAKYLSQLNSDDDSNLLRTSTIKDSTKLRSASSTAKQELKSKYPELASLVTVNPASTRDITEKIDRDEILLEYYQYGEKLYAFIVSKNGVLSFKLDGIGLVDDITNFRETIRNESSKQKRLSRKLHDRLIEPLRSSLNTKKLLIVPHGPLHYLPFNALYDGKKWIVDQYSMRLLPSASVIRFLNKNQNEEARLLVLGNPDVGDSKMDLPGSENEARQLSKIWKGSKVLLRRNASESAIRNLGSHYRYLHFASHGQFNTESPLNSRLMLAPDAENDGSLTVGEMYDLTLNADLVTLSACETGLGKIANGDDVVGLTRGFLYAGASSIVASLWEVADEPTAYIMVAFYKNLKTMPKTEALRRAQIKTRKKYPHPLYWAAFQLTGAR